LADPQLDQAECWSRAAERYEEDFVDPDRSGKRNPLRPALKKLAGRTHRIVADLGCGTGPLLPFLAEHFERVLAIDFAENMLQRARDRCRGFDNIRFVQRSLADLSGISGPVDVAVAVNSLIMPDLDELERVLTAIHGLLRPGGSFLGIVPAMDGVHYLSMLLLDRARQRGMPQSAARKNAAQLGEHELFDFTFSEFRYRGLVQHFWQPFEIPYRLRQVGFEKVRVKKLPLTWEQCSCGADLKYYAPPWDWFFQAQKKVGTSEAKG
jgi:SAM-dependent methyltransferase